MNSLYKWIVLQLFQYSGIGKDEFMVKDESVYGDLFWGGSLGLGESYMKGKWSSQNLVSLITKLTTNAIVNLVVYLLSWISPREWYRCIVALLFNQQTREKSKKVGEVHYDISPEFYSIMLGDVMMYTCGYWKGAETLEESQINKMDLLCRKMQLKSGDTVLDIGCGWGTFGKYASEKYGVHVTGLTISKGQAEYARKVCGTENVTILIEDYRDHVGCYDKIVSIGMMEAVGPSQFGVYLSKIYQLLKPGGIFALHTITSKNSTSNGDPWIGKYIFPGGSIPSNACLMKHISHTNFHFEDWQNLSVDYARTLQQWKKNFNKFLENGEDNLSEYREPVFVRMWTYYLDICISQFQSRLLDLSHIILTKEIYDRYDAPR